MGPEIPGASDIARALPDYRILGQCGRGGMSIVYLAEHIRLRRKVALKMMTHPLAAADDTFRKRFLRESQMVAGLDHPNIIPVYDAGEAGNSLYLAMRYVDGQDLRALIDTEGPLSTQKTMSIVRQVASALDAAHAQELVHRDVKPANILLASSYPDFHCYLCDFGLTKRSSTLPSLTQVGQFLGTVDYTAPEQIEGKTVDHRADIYSLGCVLYECLTGNRPFDCESDVAVIYAHLSDMPPRPTSVRPELPAGVDEVIDRALAKDPNDRFSSCGELSSALATALLAGEAEQTGPGPRARPGPETTVIRAGAGVNEGPTSGPRTVPPVTSEPPSSIPPVPPVPSFLEPGRDRSGGSGGKRRLLGVLSVIVVAALVGAALLWRARDNDHEVEARGAPKEAKQEPEVMHDEEGTGAKFSAAENQALRAHVKHEPLASCENFDKFNTTAGATAGLLCTPPPNIDAVVYWRLRGISPETKRPYPAHHWFELRAGKSRLLNNACTGAWVKTPQGQNQFKRGGPNDGQVFCYENKPDAIGSLSGIRRADRPDVEVKDHGRFVIAWYGSDFLAWAAGGDLQSLIDYWRDQL